MSTTRVVGFFRLSPLALLFLLAPGTTKNALAQCGNMGQPCSSADQCDDGVFCNGQEICLDGFCDCGPPPNCDDGLTCTLLIGCGTIEELGFFDTCLLLPNDSQCDDSQWCTGVETCDPDHPDRDGTTGCVPGTPPCDDGIPCTINECFEDTQTCGGTFFDDTSCDDGTFCNGAELCDPDDPLSDVNGCVPGINPCEDYQICDEALGMCRGCTTASECGGTFCAPLLCAPVADGSDGCVAGPAPCDDGFACTSSECNEDLSDCEPTTFDDSFCDDGNECTACFCDPGDLDADLDGCVCIPVADQTGCADDGVACTDNVCLGGVCTPVADDAFCDDGNDCTVCLCDPEDLDADVAGCVCTSVADETPCASDGIDCTDDLCINGECTHVPDDDACDDGVVCTDDVCEPAIGCINTPNDANCTGGSFCDGLEFCDPTDDCQPGLPADCPDDTPHCDPTRDECVECLTDDHCDDGIDCTLDTCVDGVCVYTPDHSACDDGVGCTDDVCDLAVGCVNTPNDANCTGGSFCDGLEFCDPNDDCQSGLPADCPSETPHCDPTREECVECLTNDHCDDDLACNGEETCVVGVCRSGTPITCDDGLACTVGQCTEPTGECEHIPDDSLCDDDNVCNGLEICDPDGDLADSVTGCVPGEPLDCDDGIECTDDRCDTLEGCSNTPNNANCTDLSLPVCNPELGGCVECSADGDCDDGDVCNGLEVCVQGACQAGIPLTCDDGIFCNGLESCDPVDGCQPGAEPACPEDEPFCDPALDTCVECLTDADCDDGLACNGIETCVLLEISDTRICQPGEPVLCDDRIDCTTSECVEPTGECLHTPNDAYCDDGDFCNGQEWCNPNVIVAGGTTDGCEPGEPPECDDGNDCTANSCANNECRFEPIAGCILPHERRVTISNKGSLMMFSKVEVKWDEAGNVIQDTFLSFTNDYPGGVNLQVYFINGDEPIRELRSQTPPFEVIREAEPGWNKFGCRFYLTSNQPRTWSASSGWLCPSFTMLDPIGPGRPDPETNGQTRVLRGYAIVWAVAFNGPENQWEEIRWNHLDGSATIVNYAEKTAWEYNAWKFRAHGVQHGRFTGTPGVLNLDGWEYDFAHSFLLLDFYASNTAVLSAPQSATYLIDTDLTLHPVSTDLRQDNDGPPITKAQFEIWNEFESKFSGTRRCIQCWDETRLSAYSTSVSIPNHFVRGTLGTDKGKARVEGMASVECDNLPPFFKLSESAALLGVAAKHIGYGNSDRRSAAGVSLMGMGERPATILYDPQQGTMEFKGFDAGRDPRNPQVRSPQVDDAKAVPYIGPVRDPILRDSDIPEE